MLFHGFPNGRNGFGLLLLRSALGIVALTQAGMDLAAHADTSAEAWIAASLAITAGISLVIGLLTPLAGALVGILAVMMGNSLVPMAQASPFTLKLSFAFVVVIAVSVALLGPGAFSLDARLFGLREIIIPSRRPPDSSTRAPE
jgi:uncharacterized membrane protein YphA (DoxX/SURF4 family)